MKTELIKAERLREGDILALPFEKYVKVVEIKPWGKKSRFLNFRIEGRLGWQRIELWHEVLIVKRERI